MYWIDAPNQSFLSRNEEALDSPDDTFIDDFELSLILMAWKEKSSSPTKDLTSLISTESVY